MFPTLQSEVFLIQLKISNVPFDEVSSQLALVMAFEDVRPLKGGSGWVDWRLNGKLSQLIYRSKFSGVRGEALLMPSGGRLDVREILFVGMGSRHNLKDAELPHLLAMLVEKLTLKRAPSFVLSLGDLIPGMFEWRNAARLFLSMLSGREENMEITLVEETAFVEDAKKRHMDFAYDVTVNYEILNS